MLCTARGDTLAAGLCREGSQQPHKVSSLLFIQGHRNICHQLTPHGRTHQAWRLPGQFFQRPM